MSRRFFDNQAFSADRPVSLGVHAAHHIARVLRMTEGEQVTLFNGLGGEWSAVLETVGKGCVIARPLVFHDLDRVPPLPVTLGLPLLKGERMDYAIRKATELGVAAIRVLRTERTEVRLKGERQSRKEAHWHQIIISACEQCGLNRPPRLATLCALDDFLTSASGLKLVAQPGAVRLSASTLAASASISLLTGPEGGLADTELAAARAAGFRALSLGERVLRAETAPVALLAAFWALL